MFWQAFRDIDDFIFKEAVDSMIANNRVAPMFEDISKAVEVANMRAIESQVRGGDMSRVSFSGVLKHAANENKTADPDYVKKCIEVAIDKTAGKLSQRQWREACEYLGIADENSSTPQQSGRDKAAGSEEK